MGAGRPGENEDEVDLMKVLVVGYGSIGKRHVINLSQLACIDEIIIYTKVKEDFDTKYEKRTVFIDAAIMDLHAVAGQYKIDFAIIANETYRHIDSAIILAEQGIHLFIEKPLSHNYERIDLLKEIVRKRCLKIFIAYNLRFLPAMQFLENQISSKIIGNLCFAQVEAGQYLPAWRPLCDYRKSYSAHNEKGGGVALDLSHEIDYMRYLFGGPVSWKIMKSKVSGLEINSEDLFEGIYYHSSGFLCSVHADYIRHNKKRGINIVGSNGTLECDFIKKYIKIQRNSGEISLIEDVHLFDVDESYKSELNHFIECIEKDKTPQITLDDGIAVLKLIECDHV